MKKTYLLCLFAALLTTGLAQNAINTGKVSGHLAAMVTQYADNSDDKDNAATPKRIKALVSLTQTCDARAFFARHGCRLIDNVGRVFIVDIPMNRVAALSFNDTIERIEAERMPHLAMEVTPQQVNATGVYAGENLPQAYTGAGVAAGVFDCYFDFTHPAFLDANGDLRVRYYYDFHWPNADSTLGHALETTASNPM